MNTERAVFILIILGLIFFIFNMSKSGDVAKEYFDKEKVVDSLNIIHTNRIDSLQDIIETAYAEADYEEALRIDMENQQKDLRRRLWGLRKDIKALQETKMIHNGTNNQNYLLLIDILNKHKFTN